MADDDWKVETRRRIQASVAHLSNQGKFERERWVADRFLTRLRVRFTGDELIKGDEPIDVAFRDACFQVKEIMDEDRKRLDEYRADLVRLETATGPADLFTYYEPKDLTVVDVVNKVEIGAARWRNNYGPNERSKLDLLFYVNLLGVEIVDDGTPLRPVDGNGFRSISFVTDRTAAVLFAGQSAPAFLRTNAGAICRDT
jgi:hypothetical protein